MQHGPGVADTSLVTSAKNREQRGVQTPYRGGVPGDEAEKAVTLETEREGLPELC